MQGKLQDKIFFETQKAYFLLKHKRNKRTQKVFTEEFKK